MNGTNYEVPHYGVLSIPHSHPSWPKYSPQDPVFKITLSLRFSLNVNNNNNNNNNNNGAIKPQRTVVSANEIICKD